jgi:hypothetical protein
LKMQTDRAGVAGKDWIFVFQSTNRSLHDEC